MTKPHDTPDRLTAKEREDYESGRWTVGKQTRLFTCSKQRCTKPPRWFGWCALHARKEADRLFSLYIRKRDQICQVCQLEFATQCGHLISRRYVALRWSPQNAIGIDVYCHKRYTENPLAWDEWCAEHVGAEDWEAMKFRAQRGGMPDLGIVIEDIRALTKELAA